MKLWLETQLAQTDRAFDGVGIKLDASVIEEAEGKRSESADGLPPSSPTALSREPKGPVKPAWRPAGRPNEISGLLKFSPQLTTAEHLCVIDKVIMPNQQYNDAAADNLQQYITGDLRPSARNLSGDRKVSPVNANCLQPKELDMSSSSRLQAHSEISRLDVIRLLAFSVLLILPTSSMAQQDPPIAEQIAKTYGLDSFGQIEAIRYTWNVGDGKVIRKWEWSPKDDTVSYEGKDKPRGVNIARLCDAPAEWSRQFEALGLTPQQ
jgi:hypothetical protein